MVKLTEVEDEHFTTEKPTPTHKDALLTSDNEEDDDFTDTGKSSFPPDLLLFELQAMGVRANRYTCSQSIKHYSRQLISFLLFMQNPKFRQNPPMNSNPKPYTSVSLP